MADEQNRAPEETPDNINEPETFSPEEEAAPPARRWLSRRNVLIGIGIPLLLIVLVAVAGFLYIRLGYAGRYIERNFVAQMDKAGVRTEIGKFETSFAPLGVIMRDVKFFDKVTGEQLAKVDYLKLDATVTDLLAPNLNRTIRLDSTEVEGLEAWVRFDEEGRSNFSRLKIPEQEQSNLTFAYSTMKFSLKNSIVHYGDVNRKISGDARNVSLFVEPDEGLSESEREVENRRFKFNLAATDSTLTYDDKLVEPIDVGVRGVWAETYADIAELTLKTPFTESRLNGRLENWEHLRYKLNVESNVDLQQAGATFKSETALRGFGNFVGVVEGEGDNYKVTGSIVSDTLAADNVRLRGLRVDASVAGEDDTYEANGKAVAEMLTYGDFQLNLMQIAGKVMGTGTDFRWMGDLRAAAARFPDGSVGQLILSDAVAEYRDERLTADIGAASAQTLEAFDAKLRGVRAVNARITDANGVTNATIGNARVANLERKGTVLRGVNASNVRVRDAQSTDVQIGRLQAQNLQDSGVNVNDLNAANVTINSRGNNIDATAGTVTAANLQKSDTRVRDLRAGNVTINSRGNRTLVNAGTVTATNVDAEAGRLRNLRAANVDIDNFGNTTNVIAANVQIGGVQTPRATLGSLNIAGVRLKVVGERIEGTSSDFSAGNVALARSESLPEGGRLENVRVSRPVFVLEPSGRYRASLDLSLGGGALGSIRVGAARAAVVATSSRVELSNLNAQIMEGNVRGNANISLDNRGSSQIAASFENLDVAKLLTLAGGQVAPISGTTTGEANLTFPGTNVRAASGTLNADFIAEAGNDERGRVPLTGRLALRATNGLFDVETARFQTGQTELNATGRFDLEGVDSNLQVALNSSNAKELQRLISALDVAPALDQQLAQNKIELDGNVAFTGTLRGNLENPTIEGRASLESISANNRALGSFSTNLFVSPAATELRDAVLAESDGGQVRFNLIAPRVGTNNISVDATLTGVDAGNIIAALPFSGVPDFLRQLRAETTGRIQLSGLPDQIEGFAEISSGAGTIGGESFDSFNTRVAFANSVAQIERFEARFDQGTLTANGTYNTATEVFNLNAEARNIPAQKIRAFLGENASSIPNINGTLDLTASGTGEGSNFRTYNINFDGVGRGVTIDNREIGDVTFVGRTQNQQLTANINASLNGQPLVAKANVNFADENLPFRAETVFDNTDLAPIASLIQQQGSVRLAGRATGTAVFGGNLRSRDEQGNLVFSTQNLRGEARFTELQLQVEDVILNATNPLTIRFTPTEVAFDNATFTGTGSNLTINGTAVLSGNGENNLIARGTLNLRVLNALASDQFFGGIAAVDIRVSGSSSNTRVIGSATLDNATFATIIGEQRLSVTNLKGRILFNSNQARIESLEGRLGGGAIVASGGVVLDNLNLDRYSLDLRGTNISVPLPRDFRTVGDIDITMSGLRRNGALESRISGRVFASRVEYTRDINLADFLSSRREGTISSGESDGSALGTIQLDVSIEGRDALVVRNNIADLTGSISMRVSGDANEPIISGRVTATGGNVVLLNNQRYDIQRAVVDFPPNNAAPVVNLQAESEIGGYQVFLGAIGPISEPESLTLNLRSNPALPYADVVSLITTGSLTDSEGGIPTLAQTGLNTAASVVTDALINEPIRRATDRLFGLNRFEIDPAISGRRGLNPSARLTVGRQINRNLSITYSTNLGADQNQVLAFEYRVSNKVSFVAQYEQAPLSNVTRRQDSFSFEVRFRRRF